MSVTPAAIAIDLGRSAPPSNSVEDQQWWLWIEDARLLIQQRLNQLGRGSISSLDQASVDYVVRKSIVAHIGHPDDATQVSIQVDDGQLSRTYKSGLGRVAIVDDLWLTLGLGDGGSSAFSVRPTFEPDVCR